MPNWTKYLDDDFDSEKFEKFSPKRKRNKTIETDEQVESEDENKKEHKREKDGSR